MVSGADTHPSMNLPEYELRPCRIASVERLIFISRLQHLVDWQLSCYAIYTKLGTI
jgi:hypothetical protein